MPNRLKFKIPFNPYVIEDKTYIGTFSIQGATMNNDELDVSLLLQKTQFACTSDVEDFPIIANSIDPVSYKQFYDQVTSFTLLIGANTSIPSPTPIELTVDCQGLIIYAGDGMIDNLKYLQLAAIGSGDTPFQRAFDLQHWGFPTDAIEVSHHAELTQTNGFRSSNELQGIAFTTTLKKKSAFLTTEKGSSITGDMIFTYHSDALRHFIGSTYRPFNSEPDQKIAYELSSQFHDQNGSYWLPCADSEAQPALTGLFIPQDKINTEFYNAIIPNQCDIRVVLNPSTLIRSFKTTQLKSVVTLLSGEGETKLFPLPRLQASDGSDDASMRPFLWFDYDAQVSSNRIDFQIIVPPVPIAITSFDLLLQVEVPIVTQSQSSSKSAPETVSANSEWEFVCHQNVNDSGILVIQPDANSQLIIKSDDFKWNMGGIKCSGKPGRADYGFSAPHTLFSVVLIRNGTEPILIYPTIYDNAGKVVRTTPLYPGYLPESDTHRKYLIPHREPTTRIIDQSGAHTLQIETNGVVNIEMTLSHYSSISALADPSVVIYFPQFQTLEDLISGIACTVQHPTSMGQLNISIMFHDMFRPTTGSPYKNPVPQAYYPHDMIRSGSVQISLGELFLEPHRHINFTCDITFKEHPYRSDHPITSIVGVFYTSAIEAARHKLPASNGLVFPKFYQRHIQVGSITTKCVSMRNTSWRPHHWPNLPLDASLEDCPLFTPHQRLDLNPSWYRVDSPVFDPYHEVSGSYGVKHFDVVPFHHCSFYLPVTCTAFNTTSSLVVEIPPVFCADYARPMLPQVPCQIASPMQSSLPLICENGHKSTSLTTSCDMLRTIGFDIPELAGSLVKPTLVSGSLITIKWSGDYDPWGLLLDFRLTNSVHVDTKPPIVLQTGVYGMMRSVALRLPFLTIHDAATTFLLRIHNTRDQSVIQTFEFTLEPPPQEESCEYGSSSNQQVDSNTYLCGCRPGYNPYQEQANQEQDTVPRYLPIVLTPFTSPASFVCLPTCQNGGRYDEAKSQCVCVNGYTGTYCTTPPPPSAEETCGAASLELPTAMCHYGYPAINQDTNKCSDCKCLVNWKSADDSVDNGKSAACTECALRDICEGDGRTHENTFRHPFCSQGKCLCARGYTGPTCAQRVVYGTLRFTRQITTEDQGEETPRENILQTLPSTMTQHILETLQASLVVPVKAVLVQATRAVEGTSLHTDVVVALGQAHGVMSTPVDADADTDPFALLGRQSTQDTSGNGNPYVHQDDLYGAWEQLMDNYTDSPLYTNPTDDLGAGVPNDAVYDPWCNAQQLADPTLVCPGGQDPLIPGEHEVDLGPEEPIDPEDSDGGSDNTTTYIIIGVVLGVVLICFIAMIVAILYCRKHQKACYRKRKASKSLEGSSNASSSSSSSTGRRSPKGSTNPHTEMTVSVATPTATISTSSFLPAPVANNDPTLPADWVQLRDQSTGKVYYSNKVTMESSWDHPAQPKEKSKSAYGW